MPLFVTLAAVTTLPADVVTSQDPDPVACDRVDAVRGVQPSVAVVMVACLWWLIAAPRMWGGRDVGAVSIGLVLTGLATLAVRPHRYLPARFIGFAMGVSGAAVAVALLSPTGWAGASTAASYVAASWTVVAVAAAVVRDRRIADLVLLLVCAGAIVEVAEAWLPWWGGNSAAAPISGTFYWYDPFAAFLIAGSVIGFSVWLGRRGPVAVFGLMGFTLGSVGLVYSTSRAAGACFALAVVALGLANVFRRRLAGAMRVAAGIGVTTFCIWAVAGPPFFSHRTLPFAGTAARASGQSLSQNGGYRMDFWHEAIGVFSRHPLTGGGYHSLASGSIGHVPQSWPLSPLAHNGYLQAVSDGGLLLGVPFLLAVAGICGWVIASLVQSVRRRDFSTVAFVLPLSVGALLAHSLVDFDWSYAANLTMVAILSGVLGGSRLAGRRPDHSVRRSRMLGAAVIAGVVVSGVAATAAWHGDLRQSLPMSQSADLGSSR